MLLIILYTHVKLHQSGTRELGNNNRAKTCLWNAYWSESHKHSQNIIQHFDTQKSIPAKGRHTVKVRVNLGFLHGILQNVSAC